MPLVPRSPRPTIFRSLLVTLAAACALAAAAPTPSLAAPGDLTPVTGPARCLTPQAADGCSGALAEAGGVFQDLAISPDGAHAYLTTADRLVVLDRDVASGRLTPTGCFDAAGDGECASPGVLDDAWREFGADEVVVSPDGEHVYVGGGGPWDSSIFVFARDGADGSLAPVSCVSETGDAVCPNADGVVNLADLEISPDGKHLYVFADNEGIAILMRDATSGALTQSAAARCIARTADWRGAQPGGCTPWTGLGQMASSGADADLAVSPDGGAVLLGGRSGVLGFARDAATGALTQSGCMSSDAVAGCQQTAHVEDVMGLAFSTDTNHLYARTDPGDGQRLLAFARPTATSVTPLAGEAGCYARPAPADGCTDVAGFGEFLGGPAALGVAADGASVLTGSTYALRSFTRDPSTGTLTAPGPAGCLRVDSADAAPVACTKAGSPFPSTTHIVVPPDGEHVYAQSGSMVLTAEREAPPLPDLAAPTVEDFTTPPLTKATYTQGSDVRAAYRCADDRPGVTCTAPVAAGERIATGTVGTNIPFKVVARDAAGRETSVTHFYDVVAKTTQQQPETKPTPTRTVLSVPPAPAPAAPPAPAPAPVNPVQAVLNWFGGALTWLTKPAQAPPKQVPAATLAKRGVSVTVEVKKPGTILNGQLVGAVVPGQSLIKPGSGPVFKDGKVVSAGGANVVSAGGANVVSAGGANVVSAGGANVVSAGGANVVSAGGANVVSAGGANLVARAAAARKPQQVVLGVGARTVTRAGRAKVTVRLTRAGRTLVARHRRAAKAQRRAGRKPAPLVLRFALVAGTSTGELPAVYITRTITIRG